MSHCSKKVLIPSHGPGSLWDLVTARQMVGCMCGQGDGAQGKESETPPGVGDRIGEALRRSDY